jgi:hypothetical protein
MEGILLVVSNNKQFIIFTGITVTEDLKSNLCKFDSCVGCRCLKRQPRSTITNVYFCYLSKEMSRQEEYAVAGETLWPIKGPYFSCRVRSNQ